MSALRALQTPSGSPAFRQSSRPFWLSATVGLVLGCVVACQPARPDDDQLMVFAAASLRDALEQIRVEAEQQGLRPEFNFAGSNVLARQIEATSSADLLLSANHQWVEHLRQRGRLVDRSITPFLGNRLVVIGHASRSAQLESIAELATLPFQHLSLGDPRAVPAGIYASALLQSVELPAGSLWSMLADRVVPAPDVRAALALVEARPDAVGMVYRSDALASRRIEVLYEIPAAETPQIRYWAALVADGSSPQTARRFLALLRSPVAARIFAEHGFEPHP
nr:molybdate-binding protein ModA-like [Nerophis lumbriciformis]